MLQKNIEEIVEGDLQYLKENAVLEQKTLEYKRELPGNSDKDKIEFLKDISSFANSVGGDILFGISCDNSTGKPVEIGGITIDNPEKEILRLESSIREGIAPRIFGIQIKAVQVSNSNFVLIIRIPKSWNSPHLVSYNRHGRFWARSTAGKYQMDVTELRNAFNLSVSATERIRNFRIDRVSRIIADDTSFPLLNNPKIVLHITPLSSLNSARVYNIEIVKQNPHLLQSFNNFASRNRFNLDGIVTHPSDIDGKYDSYTQLYRNGIIEAVEAGMLEPRGKQLSIPSRLFEDKTIELVSTYLSLYKTLAIELPAYIFLSLLNVKGYYMATGGSPFTYRGHYIDRDNLLISEGLINDYEENPEDFLKPCFDSVWNASGHSRSPNYDKDGRRIERQ